MAGNEETRFGAELAVLERAAERARTEVERLSLLVTTLKANVTQVKQNISLLESSGSRVVTLTEYRKMRVEAAQLSRELNAVEADLRRKNKNLKRLLQEILALRRPSSP